MRIEDLLAILSLKHIDKFGIPPNKTKLIKLAYLAEVYYKSNTSNRLTDLEWIYWIFGPYIRDIDSVLANDSIFVAPSEHANFIPIVVREDYEHVTSTLDENIAILSALDHGTDDLNQLLDFVYFETEPMIKAKSRGELLDFGSVLPQSYYSIKSYRVSEKQREEISKRIEEWKSRRAHASQP